MPHVLLLEDDPARVGRFVAAVRALSSNLSLRVWRDAHAMMREAGPLLEAAVLVSLDHDLVPERPGHDPGDGYLAAQWLAARPVVPPVIIHTSNATRADWMAGAFELTGRAFRTVAPIGDDWIERDWVSVARELLAAAGPA
jgi:hypothetical protein